jgi:hypothetical protein
MPEESGAPMWTARSGLVDFLAGGVGGAGMVMMSHPSDTVKLLLQVCMAGCMSGLCVREVGWGGGAWTGDARPNTTWGWEVHRIP